MILFKRHIFKNKFITSYDDWSTDWDEVREKWRVRTSYYKPSWIQLFILFLRTGRFYSSHLITHKTGKVNFYLDLHLKKEKKRKEPKSVMYIPDWRK